MADAEPKGMQVYPRSLSACKGEQSRGREGRSGSMLCVVCEEPDAPARTASLGGPARPVHELPEADTVLMWAASDQT